MKNLLNLKYAAATLFILGLISLAGCNRKEGPLGLERTEPEQADTILKSSGNDIALGQSQILFFDHFEHDLSKWTGKFGGEHHAVIVEDQLQPGNHVVTFTALNFAGDIFSEEVEVEEGFTYELSFQYLGLPDRGGVPDDLGGAIGFAEGLTELGNRFLAATVLCCGAESDMLIDDGQWHSYSIEFDPFKPGEFYDGTPDNGTIRVIVEDFVGSGGVAGDIFFDDIQLVLKQVTICHKPDTPAQKTLVIPVQDLPGHLGHGDTIGPCE